MRKPTFKPTQVVSIPNVTHTLQDARPVPNCPPLYDVLDEGCKILHSYSLGALEDLHNALGQLLSKARRGQFERIQ